MPSPSIQMTDYILRHCLGWLTTPRSRYSWYSQAIALAPRFINLLETLLVACFGIMIPVGPKAHGRSLAFSGGRVQVWCGSGHTWGQW